MCRTETGFLWAAVQDAVLSFCFRGSPVDAGMGVIFGSVPAAVTLYLAYNQDSGALWKLVLMTVIHLAIFLFSLSRSARLLEGQRENIRRALS